MQDEHFDLGDALLADGIHIETNEVEVPPSATGSLLEATAWEPEVLNSDLANARRIVKNHGQDLAYTPERGWFVWTGTHYVPDKALVMQRAKKSALSIYDEIKSAPNNLRAPLFKWATASQAAERLKAAIFLAQSEPEIARKYSDFNSDPWILNCQNGTVDLKTGRLRAHRREDLCSKITPVHFDPSAQCPLFLKFLGRIMADNPALIDYLKRLIGYSLTGITSEQILVFLLGSGANGKSVLLELVKELLGDYGLNAPTSTLMHKQQGGIPNDIARLAGARFVSVNETGEGQRLNEPLVKDLTGGDTISARFLHKEFFDFRPQFKLWMRRNHKPQIRGTDDGIWRRIHLIPFSVQIPAEERDGSLSVKLRDELPGMLAWAVQGCLQWQSKGLLPPREVLHAAQQYRAEMDILGTFICEVCVKGESNKVAARAFYTAYVEWAEANGERPVSQTSFGVALTERGFVKKKTRKGHFYQGIGLSVQGVHSCEGFSSISPHNARAIENNLKHGAQPYNPTHGVVKVHTGETVTVLEVLDEV